MMFMNGEYVEDILDYLMALSMNLPG